MTSASPPSTSRAASDELLAGLRAGQWRPAAWARFVVSSARRSVQQAVQHPRALTEVTVLHAALALAAGGHGRRWVAASDAAAAQQDVVRSMLADGLSLARIPAGRYYTATEPVVLLAGAAAAVSERYGGDGRYHPAGYLVCRLDSDVLQALGIGPSTTLQASRFTALIPATPNNLPYPQVSALIEEAALLDTVIGAAASGVPGPALAANLVVWLEGGWPLYYGRPAGNPPSPVAVNAWPGANPWMSLTLLWEARFHPLLDTSADGARVDYPPGFFTENYSLDPGNPRMIAYAPAADGIKVDPEKIDFDPDIPNSGTTRYLGSSVLSTTAADNLRNQLAKYPPHDLDPTLEEIAQLLAHTDIALQGLTGFNDALLTRQSALQLSIGVSPNARLPFRTATQQTTSVITWLSDGLVGYFKQAAGGGEVPRALRTVRPLASGAPSSIHTH